MSVASIAQPLGDARPGGRRAGHIDRRNGLTQREFVREYLDPLKPVIVTDAIQHWAAGRKWTPAFFREAYGSRSVTVDGLQHRLSDLLDLIERSNESAPAPYLRNVGIADWAPELLADIQPLPIQTRPNWLDSPLFPERPSLMSLELDIGGVGTPFPTLHFDHMHTHAFLMQLFGSKEYVVYSPAQTRWLYPRAGIEANKSSIDDLDHPDLTRFPLFARAVPGRCVLRAGETLFVPSGWWHTARILEASITVSANAVNASNWEGFVGDYLRSASRHRSPTALALLTTYLRVFRFIERFAL
jgi:histone arginine demethylase JMJD6